MDNLYYCPNCNFWAYLDIIETDRGTRHWRCNKCNHRGDIRYHLDGTSYLSDLTMFKDLPVPPKPWGDSL